MRSIRRWDLAIKLLIISRWKKGEEKLYLEYSRSRRDLCFLLLCFRLGDLLLVRDLPILMCFVRIKLANKQIFHPMQIKSKFIVFLLALVYPLDWAFLSRIKPVRWDFN